MNSFAHTRRNSVLSVLSFAACLAAASVGNAQTPSAPPATADPVVQPAIDGVLKAFESHPIVAVGDAHGTAEEGAFYVALISDRRFAKEVGNVVVEFGGSAHQETIDRYVAGEAVPYTELRKVWTDVVGWVPTVAWLEYVDFFAAVRAANAKLPADQRIHVWLGEPPIDWSKIKTQADLTSGRFDRNQFPADLIKREILSKGKKSLVIYGGLHFRFDNGIDERVEADYPHSFFVVTPYWGFQQQACDAALETRAADWPEPTLVSPIKGTWLVGLLRAPGCTFQPGPPAGRAPPTPEQAAMMKDADDDTSGVKSDALLYLGGANSLTQSPVDPAFFLDQDYFNEIARRYQIMTGQPLNWANFVAINGRGTTTVRERYGRAPPPIPDGLRAAIDEKTLDRYVGFYQLRAWRVLTVTRRGPQLWGQLTGGKPVPIHALGHASFWSRSFARPFNFVADTNGRVTSIEFDQAVGDTLAPRIDDKVAQQIASKIEARIKSQAQNPGTEAALRRTIEDYVAGKPNYERMNPALADLTHQILPSLQADLNRLGPVKSIKFVGVSNQGQDMYEVTQEHGVSHWSLALDAEGKIDTLQLQFPNP